MCFEILGGNRLEDGRGEILYAVPYVPENRIVTLRETEDGYQVLPDLKQAAAAS